MHVDVKDRLAGACAGVNYCPVAALSQSFLICNTSRDAQQVAQQLFIACRSVV
jgi:hypothetical protein